MSNIVKNVFWWKKSSGPTHPYLLLSLSAFLTKALSSWLETWMDSFSLASSPSSLLRSRVSFRCRSRSWATSWSSLWAWIRSRRAPTSPSSASCSCWRRLSNLIHRFDKTRHAYIRPCNVFLCPSRWVLTSSRLHDSKKWEKTILLPLLA